MQDDDPEDADLRQAFAVLRREDGQAAPTFASVRARERAGPLRFAPLGGLLAAATVAAVLLGIVRRPGPPRPMESMELWVAPTDFLLNTPGSEIVRTVPRIGDVPRRVSP